jgi:glutathione synthase/RimK-type ligase-like ATP-grasp enzyme
MLTFLRRRSLGRTSCREISNYMKSASYIIRADRLKEDDLEAVDILVRWGCTSTISREENTLILNEAKAIHIVNDKIEFRKILQEHELCPFTFFEVKDAVYPCIVRKRQHAQGKYLYVIQDEAALIDLIEQLGEDNWYGSELIKKSKEFRVFVGSGRVIWVANKIPGNPDDIAWNVAQGGKFEVVKFDDWHLRSVKAAIKAWELSGLDFGGVDVIVNGDNKAYVVEINSAPSQTSPYRQQCCAKYFDYIVENGNDTIPLTEELGGWKKFIHPAISESAIV